MSERKGQIGPFLVLSGTVFGVLLLGAGLRTSAERVTSPVPPSEKPRREPVRAVAPLEEPRRSPPLPEIVPAPPPREVARDHEAAPLGEGQVETRAQLDRERLTLPGPDWTAQFVVLCERPSVERQISAYGPDSELYLLPATIKGRACWALCWGRYASREDALAASGLPASLRSSEPHPRSLTEALR
jgi:hypothetical protein